MKTKLIRRLSSAIFAAALSAGAAASAQTPQPANPQSNGPVKVDSETISGLGARNIGSAQMSGRVAAIDAVREGQRLTRLRRLRHGRRLEVASTAARPTSPSSTSSPCSRSARSPSTRRTRRRSGSAPASRGRATASPSATASTNRPTAATTGRTSASKSPSASSKILVDPTNTDTVYVCAPGKLWSDCDERGVYKTTDGGKSWTKVLKGANASTGCSMLVDGQRRTRRRSTPACGTSAARAGRSAPAATDRERAERQRPFQVHRRRRDVDRARPSRARRASREAVGPRRRHRRALEAERRLRLHRGRRRRRTALYRSDDGGKTWAGARPQPEHGLASVLLREPHRRSEEREQALQSRTSGSSSANDGGKSFSGHRRRRRTATSTTSGSIPNNTDHVIAGDDGGLWYSYDAGNRWWKARQPADLAVLPRERRHGHAVPRLRRPAGQQLWVGDSQYPGGITNSPLGEHVRRRRLLDVRRSDRSRLHLRRGAGRRDRPRQPQDARVAPHQAAPELQREEAPLQLEHAHPRLPDAEGHDLHRLAVPLPLARPRPDLGAHLARPHDERSRRSRSRSSRAASPSTTPRPRCTRRSTPSPSRRRTAT